MFGRLRVLLPSVCIAASTTLSPLPAQDFTAEVHRDPNAGAAVYDFRFQGPPRGSMGVLVGTLLSSPVPTPFGPLFLDPRALVLLGPVRLSASGQGQLQLALPLGPTSGAVVTAQAIALDVRNVVVLTDWASVHHDAIQSSNKSLSWWGGYRGATRKYRLDFCGPASAQVELRINGGQTATGRVVLDGNGKGRIELAVPGGLRAGDGLELRCGGQQIRSWRY